MQLSKYSFRFSCNARICQKTACFQPSLFSLDNSICENREWRCPTFSSGGPCVCVFFLPTRLKYSGIKMRKKKKHFYMLCNRHSLVILLTKDQYENPLVESAENLVLYSALLLLFCILLCWKNHEVHVIITSSVKMIDSKETQDGNLVQVFLDKRTKWQMHCNTDSLWYESRCTDIQSLCFYI